MSVLTNRRKTPTVPEITEAPPDPTGVVYVIGVCKPDSQKLAGLTHTGLMTRSEAAYELDRWNRTSLRKHVLLKVSEVVDE